MKYYLIQLLLLVEREIGLSDHLRLGEVATKEMLRRDQCHDARPVDCGDAVDGAKAW